MRIAQHGRRLLLRRVAPTVAATFIVVAAAACSDTQTSSDPLLGKRIDISQAALLGDSTGARASIATLAPNGERLLLNFWASWCLPCRDEIPLLAAYAASSTASVPRAVVVGVLYRDEPGPGAAAAAELGATWPTLLDPDGAIAAQVPVNAAPLTLLLDTSGTVLDYRVGPFANSDEIRSFVTAP